MLSLLTKFVHSRAYWIAVIVVGVSIEAVALFYQHVLGEPPCVLCIQARFWTVLGIVFSLFGLALNKIAAVRLIAQLGLMASLSMVLNRSWISVLVERGQYEGQCGMDPGFPAWFALDKWLPNMFEVWTMCGYTPNFIFGLTMGEGLVYGTIALLAICLLAFGLMVSSLIKAR